MKKAIPLSLVGVLIILIVLSVCKIEDGTEKYIKNIKTEVKQKVSTSKKPIKKENIADKKTEQIDENNEQQITEQESPAEEIIEEPIIEEVQYSSQYETRMTSYYPEEGENITGTGLGPSDFEINDNGWFTYNGKLVIATATQYLLNYGFSLSDGIHTYNYYDELTLNIDGIDYQAIVLDSCGSAMSNGRIDLYVSSVNYIKDTQIIVKE